MLIIYVIASLLACTILLGVDASKNWRFLPKLNKRLYVVSAVATAVTASAFHKTLPPVHQVPTKPGSDGQATSSTLQEREKRFNGLLFQGFIGGDHSSVYKLMGEVHPENKTILQLATFLILEPVA